MDLVPILILAAICLAIGFISAILITNLGKTEEESPPRETPDGQVEIMRVLREGDSGDIVPEVDGQAISTPEDLNPGQHAKLSLALVDFYQWMDQGPMAMPKLERSTHISEAESTSQPEEGDDEATATIEVDSEKKVSSSQPEKVSVEPASINPFKSLINVARSEIKQKVASPLPSIAAQVDEILQKKIAGSDLEEKGIRLMDLPDKGMVILIGLDKYDEIENVPDEAIQEVLRGAVAEWEKNMLENSKS